MTSGVVVGDLRECVETVLGEDDLAARLGEEDLGAAAIVLLSSMTITFRPAKVHAVFLVGCRAVASGPRSRPSRSLPLRALHSGQVQFGGTSSPARARRDALVGQARRFVG